MKSLKEVKRILTENKVKLKKKYDIKEMGIFGSFVKGSQKKNSDIDILVEFKVVPDLFRFIELERNIQKILGVKVDLVRKKSIREEFKHEIVREMVTI